MQTARAVKSEGSVAAGIFCFAHGRQRGFESAVGEDQKQHGFQPLAGAGGRDGCSRNCPVMALEHEHAHNDHGEQRHQLGCGEHVAHLRSGADATNVDEGEKTHEHGEDDGARQGIFRVRKELSQVNHKQVRVRGRRGDLSQPEHPGGLNAHQATESDSGVEVGTSSLLKARCDLGEATDNHAHSGAGREHGVGAVVADENCDLRG